MLGNKTQSQALSVTLGASWALFIRIAGLGLALLAQVALARTLGVDGFGRFSYAMSWAIWLSALATLGYPVAVQRLVPVYLEGQERHPIKGLLRYTSLAVLATALPVGVAGFWVLRHSNAAPLGTWALALAAGAVPLMALAQLAGGWLKAVRSVRAALVPDLIFRPLALLLLSLAVAIGFPTTNSAALTAAAFAVLTLTLAAAVLVQLFTLRGALRRAFSSWPDLSTTRATQPQTSLESFAHPTSTRQQRREWRQLALPLLLVSGFSILLKRTDVMMLGWWLDASAVGRYHAAARMAELTGFALTAVTVAAPPVFAAHWAAGQKQQLQALLRRLSQWILVPSLVIATALAIAAIPLLGLFGEAFQSARPVLLVLICGHLVNALSGPVGFLLSMTGHQRQVAWTYGIAVVLNAILNALAISTYGPVGAALATASVMAVWNLSLLYLARTRLGLNPSVTNQLQRQPHHEH